MVWKVKLDGVKLSPIGFQAIWMNQHCEKTAKCPVKSSLCETEEDSSSKSSKEHLLFLYLSFIVENLSKFEFGG